MKMKAAIACRAFKRNLGKIPNMEQTAKVSTFNALFSQKSTIFVPYLPRVGSTIPTLTQRGGEAPT